MYIGRIKKYICFVDHLIIETRWVCWMWTLDKIRLWLPVSHRLLSCQQILHEATEMEEPPGAVPTPVIWSESSLLSLWQAANQRGSSVWRAVPWRPSGLPWPRRRSRMWSKSTPTSGSWGSSTWRSDPSQDISSRSNTKYGSISVVSIIVIVEIYCPNKSIRHIDENAFNVLFYLFLSRLLCKNN